MVVVVVEEVVVVLVVLVGGADIAWYPCVCPVVLCPAVHLASITAGWTDSCNAWWCWADDECPEVVSWCGGAR